MIFEPVILEARAEVVPTQMVLQAVWDQLARGIMALQLQTLPAIHKEDLVQAEVERDRQDHKGREIPQSAEMVVWVYSFPSLTLVFFMLAAEVEWVKGLVQINVRVQVAQV
ncbi:hypothetical protein C943_01583 [Mariniradius saccharolyticus AK6]|uniref:Uncharacterized protein n=1 Tax=Mariniradius saccharolyticus AK6 TaxID=1239962 RepID=M7XBN3_9BACT|nr:hypothetical protein C943_01583 [Mariniradius saccharolyticus AK6]